MARADFLGIALKKKKKKIPSLYKVSFEIAKYTHTELWLDKLLKRRRLL